MALIRRQSNQQRVFIGLFCFIILVLWHTGRLSSCTNPRPKTVPGPAHSSSHNYLPCRNLPGANDTVVIVKTGSTELPDRLPIHLTTTLRCYPNYLIFSDHEEYYQGEHIIDALDDVSTKIREEHPDFHLHRRLRQMGRQALAPEEIHHDVARADAWTGHTENPGWKLDKWKFLPMVKRTYEEYPNKKWYVFVEADTYLLWASYLQFVAALDHTKPHYTGNQMAIGPDLFAHGGSAFIVSNPGMKTVVDHYNNDKDGIETFTGNHWAGDCVLGVAFRNAGVPFTFAWPVLQTDDPGQIPYTQADGRLVDDPKKRPWCYPTVSYHHTNAELVEDLWKFEQQWISSKDESNTGYLRHKDFFAQYTIPRMLTPKTDWDNLSDHKEDTVQSFEDCKAMCEADRDCLQYALYEGGICKTSPAPKLGKSSKGVRSGWFVDRMWDMHDNMPRCTDESWPL